MKRTISLFFVFALLLAACGQADSEPASEQPTTAPPAETTTTTQAPPTTAVAPQATEEPATRTVSHALGDTEVPLEIERWVVLDEYAGVSLIVLGIEPTVVFRGYGTAISAAVLEAEGISLQDSAMGIVNFETVAGYEPDVIVATWDPGMVEFYEDLSAIAPTVLLPFVEPWRDVVSATGEYFQKEEEAARVVASIEERIAEIADLVAENPKSISVLGAFGEMVFTPANEISLSRVIAETGVTRPAAQADAPADANFAPIVSLSAEVLVDHNADEILLLTGTVYGAAEPITSTPTFQSLGAVESGNVSMVSGEMWFGTFGFAFDWMLSDIHAIVTGEGAVGSDADAEARWSDFQARVAG